MNTYDLIAVLSGPRLIVLLGLPVSFRGLLGTRGNSMQSPVKAGVFRFTMWFRQNERQSFQKDFRYNEKKYSSQSSNLNSFESHLTLNCSELQTKQWIHSVLVIVCLNGIALFKNGNSKKISATVTWILPISLKVILSKFYPFLLHHNQQNMTAKY